MPSNNQQPTTNNQTKPNMSKQLHYGVITDDEISLRGPKMVDEGPFTSLREAFNEAIDYLLTDPDGFAKVVVCKLEDPNDPIWVEDWNYTGVTIDASNSPWVCPDDDEENNQRKE